MPHDRAVDEASLIKATFTGLVMDLFATGDRRRLTKAMNDFLERLTRDRRRQHDVMQQRSPSLLPSLRGALGDRPDACPWPGSRVSWAT
jgi:hypothetical protein